MKPVLAVVSLALGMVLGLSAGILVRAPEALFDPRSLLPEDAPDACVEVVEAAQQLAGITTEYLQLIEDTYVPVLEDVVDDGAIPQPTGPAPPSPVGRATGSVTTPEAGGGPTPANGLVDALLTAEQRMADLSARTATATGVLTESGAICRGESRE
jgi:hypothetical protein